MAVSGVERATVEVDGVPASYLAAGALQARDLALVNSVTHDSWPVPGVARFWDPAVVAATSMRDLVAARRQAITVALARPAIEAAAVARALTEFFAT